MMNEEIECTGEVLPDGRISVDPSISHKLRTGQKLRIRIEQIPDTPEPQSKKELDSATQRILEKNEECRISFDTGQSC